MRRAPDAGALFAFRSSPLREVQGKIKHLETAACPFVNLPHRRPGAWGQGIAKEKMSGCIWAKLEILAEIDFAEWIPDERPRHAAFIWIRVDKKARQVVRQT